MTPRCKNGPWTEQRATLVAVATASSAIAFLAWTRATMSWIDVGGLVVGGVIGLASARQGSEGLAMKLATGGNLACILASIAIPAAVPFTSVAVVTLCAAVGGAWLASRRRARQRTRDRAAQRHGEDTRLSGLALLIEMVFLVIVLLWWLSR